MHLMVIVTSYFEDYLNAQKIITKNMYIIEIIKFYMNILSDSIIKVRTQLQTPGSFFNNVT